MLVCGSQSDAYQHAASRAIVRAISQADSVQAYLAGPATPTSAAAVIAAAVAAVAYRFADSGRLMDVRLPLPDLCSCQLLLETVCELSQTAVVFQKCHAVLGPCLQLLACCGAVRCHLISLLGESRAASQSIIELLQWKMSGVDQWHPSKTAPSSRQSETSSSSALSGRASTWFG